jgi:hypothetical protein
MSRFNRSIVAAVVFSLTILTGLFILTSLSSSNSTHANAKGTSHWANAKRIDADVKAGKITFDEALLLKTLSIQTPWVLPDEYRPSAPARDTTAVLLEVLDQLPKAHPEVQNFIRFILARPDKRQHMSEPGLYSAPVSRKDIASKSVELVLAAPSTVYDTPEGHFRIFYDTKGPNSSSLAYAQQLGGFLETSWSHEVTTLGFRSPDLGSDGKVEVFILELGNTLFGRADTDGFLEINRDMSWAPPNDDPAGDSTGALKVTAAHEFFHLIQFATTSFLGRDGESWWLESSATFMEDEVFDGVNDYRNYLSQFFNSTQVTIDSIDGGYETVLINKLLKEKFNGGDPKIVKEVLEGLGVFTSTEESMASVLGGKGSSLADGFKHFALWNFMVGSRHDASFYEEGSTYPTFANFQDSHSLSSTNTSTGERSISVNNLAANYYRITPDSGLTTAQKLTVEVGRSSDQIRGWVVVEAKAGSDDIKELSFGADGKAKVTVDDFSASNTDEVVLILSNGDEHFAKSAKYRASLEQGIDIIFAIDTTGSMFDDIAAVKLAATQIVDDLDSRGVDYRVAVMNYEDFPVSPFGSAGCGDATFHDVLGFSKDRSSIVSAIQSLTLRCGGDTPEAVLSASMHAIDSTSLGTWRKNAKKAIILMGDAPGHDPEPFTGFTTAAVIAAARARTGSLAPVISQSLIPSFIPTALAAGEDPVHIYPILIGFDFSARTQFSQLATGTDGKLFEAPTAGDVVEAIIEALGTIVTPTNSAPNCNFAVANPSQLWPVNHRLVPISILGVTDADGDALTFTINGITQDEPILGLGDGDTSPDGAGIGSSTPSVRAERSGKGNGRIYEIIFSVNDGKGGQCLGKVKISVAHDRGANSIAADDGQVYGSTSP